jgi:general secretion pathway protein J
LSAKQGFTLLELLVAMAIFAVISVITFQGLQGMMQSRAIMDAETARLAGLQGAMALMSRDFEQMVARPIRDEFGDMQPAVTCTAEDGTTIEFSRGGWRNPAALARSTMQRVAYHLTGSTLVRETWPVLDRAATTKSVSRELVAGVLRFGLRFQDTDDQWQPSWPSPAEALAVDKQGQLPKAVEVTLELEEWGTLTRLFVVAWQGGS